LTVDLWEFTENDWECYDLGISYNFIYIEVSFKLLDKNKLIYVYIKANLNSYKMNKNMSSDSRSKIKIKLRLVH